MAKKRLSVDPPTVCPPRHLCADDDRPRGVLIPPEELSGEPHGEREREEDHARQPVHLARELVGPEEEHLPHVDAHHEDHRRRAVVVQAAEHVAEAVVRDEIQRLVGLG
jgi:hypothetical protein